MTEAEWQEGRDLHPMLLFTAERLTGRKLQLYTVGCCRRHWELFNRDEAKRLVSDAEQLADGIGDEDAVRQLAQDALRTYLDLTIPWVQRTLTQAAREWGGGSAVPDDVTFVVVKVVVDGAKT